MELKMISQDEADLLLSATFITSKIMSITARSSSCFIIISSCIILVNCQVSVYIS
jgi:hypothetical protein